MQRYFSSKLENNYLKLNNDDLYHIQTVMRMKVNDLIEVVYNNEVYECKLSLVNSRYMAEIVSKLDIKKSNIPNVNLIIPFLKEQKMDYILQKATELGASMITFVSFERSMIKLSPDKLSNRKERWIRICKEASEQSKRVIIVLNSLNELSNIQGVKLVCSTNEKQNYLQKFLKKHNTCGTINLVIGPEGGITDKEEILLEKMGFCKITLGNFILRVETVPLYLMSVIQYEYGTYI